MKLNISVVVLISLASAITSAITSYCLEKNRITIKLQDIPTVGLDIPTVGLDIPKEYFKLKDKWESIRESDELVIGSHLVLLAGIGLKLGGFITCVISAVCAAAIYFFVYSTVEKKVKREYIEESITELTPDIIDRRMEVFSEAIQGAKVRDSLSIFLVAACLVIVIWIVK